MESAALNARSHSTPNRCVFESPATQKADGIIATMNADGRWLHRPEGRCHEELKAEGGK